MYSDQEILQIIDNVFNIVEKPKMFIDPALSEEHAEHNDTLLSRSKSTLQLEDVGNPGWNPISYISGEGMAYFFPALTRLALDPPEYGYDWYAELLLMHLTLGEAFEKFYNYCSVEQKAAVAEFINHIIITRVELIEKHNCRNDFARAFELWQPLIH